jgi:uncharacterized protein YdaL
MGKSCKGTDYGMKLLLCGILVWGLLVNPIFVKAENPEPGDSKILVVFSSKNGEIDEHGRLLDLLLSHFTTNLSLKSSKEVKKKDLDKITHLFYYGQVEEQLPSSLLNLLQSYKGPFVAIGQNIEQVKSHFSFIQLNGVGTYTEVVLSSNAEKHIAVDPQNILKVDIGPNTEVIVEAKQGDNRYPLFIKQNQAYYYATDNLFPPNSNFLAEALHEVFMVNHATATQGFLRLEDIHPGLEGDLVMEIARTLKQRNIPYMASVIPVYVNSETEEEYHLSDNPELLEALKYMQSNGGSIVLHGYTDQYQKGESGDGFEFWNLEKNTPIYFKPGDQTMIKTKDDFESPTAYEQYIKEKKTFETAYIEDLLTKGIQELVDYGLYPLAFESPSYAMSQNGYKVISKYFSTYVGQIQLTDEDWKVMTESPYLAYPSSLHGMKLLPETIRYVRYEDPTSILEMKARVNDFTVVRDGMIGGFYHPFLGVKGLIDLLNEMEKFPNVEWIDLKEMNNTVKTDTVHIKSEKGEILVDVKREQLASVTTPSFLLNFINLSKENKLWIMAGAGITMSMILTSYILLKRIQRTKRSWNE